MQGGKKNPGEGGVCLLKGVFGIRPTGAIGVRREKMHVHIRRQHLVLGPHVQVLALSLLPQKRDPASALSFCVWHGGSGGKGLWGGLGTLGQIFTCFSLTSKSRGKKAGRQSPILEENWTPEIVLSLFLNVRYVLKSLRDCVSDPLTAVWALLAAQFGEGSIGRG